MSDQTDTPPPSKPLDTYIELVKTTLGGLRKGMGEHLAKASAQKQFEADASALATVIQQQEISLRNLRGIRPDVPAVFDGTGAQTIAPGFSQGTLKKRKEAEEFVGKLTNMINNALESGDYSKIHEQAKKNIKDATPAQPGGDSATDETATKG